MELVIAAVACVGLTVLLIVIFADKQQYMPPSLGGCDKRGCPCGPVFSCDANCACATLPDKRGGAKK